MLLDLTVLLKTSKQTYLDKAEKSVGWRVLCGIQVRELKVGEARFCKACM